MQSSVEISLQKKLLQLIQTYKREASQSYNDQEGKQNSVKSNSLIITYIQIEKMSPRIKTILEDSFQYIIQLTIVNCDLRTFENFPKLKSIKNLNASKNSLRGSFEFLVKNRTIKYIDVSNNIIADIKRFEPLKYIKQVSLYAKNNPFENKKNNEHGNGKLTFLQQLKNFGVKYLQNPLRVVKEVKKQDINYKKVPLPNAVEQNRSKILTKLERDRKLIVEREGFGLEDIASYMRSRLSPRSSQIQQSNARSSPVRQQDVISNSENQSILRVESNASGSVRDHLDMENIQHFIQENEEEDDDDGEDLDEQEIQFFVNLERQQRQARRRTRHSSQALRLLQRIQSQSNLMEEFSSVLSEDSELEDDDNDNDNDNENENEKDNQNDF